MAWIETATGLDLRTVAPHSRLAAATYTSQLLKPGQAMEVSDQCDPVDVFDDFERKRGRFVWEYLERGPKVWRVRVTRARTIDCPRRCLATATEAASMSDILAPA